MENNYDPYGQQNSNGNDTGYTPNPNVQQGGYQSQPNQYQQPQQPSYQPNQYQQPQQPSYQPSQYQQQNVATPTQPQDNSQYAQPQDNSQYAQPQDNSQYQQPMQQYNPNQYQQQQPISQSSSIAKASLICGCAGIFLSFFMSKVSALGALGLGLAIAALCLGITARKRGERGIATAGMVI
ncbi:MAG: hypothetical protein RSA79_05660, partial [Oscillospiraceae bacterium]